jgi:hypothetical protein
MSFLAKLMTNAANTSAITTTGEDTAKVVGLRVNAGDIVYLPPDEYQGKSISQLFADNANELGISSAQVSKYLTNGNAVAGTDTPLPGAIYQGTTMTMQKG